MMNIKSIKLSSFSSPKLFSNFKGEQTKLSFNVEGKNSFSSPRFSFSTLQNKKQQIRKEISHSNIKQEQKQIFNSTKNFTLTKPFFYCTSPLHKKQTQTYVNYQKKEDDEARINELVTLFNFPDKLKNFVVKDENRGLFGIKRLHKPEDYSLILDDISKAVENERKMISKLLSEELTYEISIQILNTMDKISEIICDGIDPAMLCTSTHEDDSWRDSSRDVFMKLSALINELNTDNEMKGSLDKIMEREEIFSQFNEEQREVTIHLANEFKSYAIFHPTEVKGREDLYTFQKRIMDLSWEFEENAANDLEENYPLVRVPSHAFDHLREKSEKGEILIRPTNQHLNILFTSIKDRKIRREIFKANRQFAESNIGILNDLADERNKMAKFLGKKSFAELTLETRSAIKSPEKVVEFLNTLSDLIKPAVDNELNYLKELRLKEQNVPLSNPLFTFDFYHFDACSRPKRFSSDKNVRNKSSAGYEEYFSLGYCIKGLDNLVTKLFGLRLHVTPMSETESWDPYVYRVEVHDEVKGLIGVIYFDLFARPSKFQGGSNFTISFSTKRNQKIAHLALIMQISDTPRKKSGKAVFLNYLELSTLFHEFGHSLNTILSETDYQHLAGVRSPIDFVETPSTLMELFCRDYRVISTFARHIETNEIIPEELLNNVVHSYEQFRALETQWSIALSLFDLKLHSDHYDSFQLFHEILRDYYAVVEEEESWWFTRWTHIVRVNYAASYYTYLKCNVNSAAIWKECFEQSPFNREVGERYKKEILSIGGTRNTEAMLRNMIGKDVNTKHFCDIILNSFTKSMK